MLFTKNARHVILIIKLNELVREVLLHYEMHNSDVVINLNTCNFKKSLKIKLIALKIWLFSLLCFHLKNEQFSCFSAQNQPMLAFLEISLI